MKTIFTKAVSLVLLISIYALGTNQVLSMTEQSDIIIKLNENVLFFDAQPRIIQGRTLVPIASLAKDLGATTEWIPDTKSVIVNMQTKDKTKMIYLKIGQKSALVDGLEVELDTAVTIYENRTFVPLRFISETFGASVDWNGETRTVSISYKEPELGEPPRLIPPWEVLNQKW